MESNPITVQPNFLLPFSCPFRSGKWSDLISPSGFLFTFISSYIPGLPCWTTYRGQTHHQCYSATVTRHQWQAKPPITTSAEQIAKPPKNMRERTQIRNLTGVKCVNSRYHNNVVVVEIYYPIYKRNVLFVRLSVRLYYIICNFSQYLSDTTKDCFISRNSFNTCCNKIYQVLWSNEGRGDKNVAATVRLVVNNDNSDTNSLFGTVKDALSGWKKKNSIHW